MVDDMVGYREESPRKHRGKRRCGKGGLFIYHPPILGDFLGLGSWFRGWVDCMPVRWQFMQVAESRSKHFPTLSIFRCLCTENEPQNKISAFPNRRFLGGRLVPVSSDSRYHWRLSIQRMRTMPMTTTMMQALATGCYYHRLQ